MGRDVASSGYTSPWVCTQCGICAAVCPVSAIRAEAGANGYRYPRVAAEQCTSCGICAKVCPGPHLSTEQAPLPPSLSTNVYGPCETCLLAHAADAPTRWDAASGGAVTALLLSLRRQGLIAGAVVTTLTANGTPRTFLARDESEIRAACGSKYIITSMTDGIRQVLREDGPVAVVGLPCQINGLNRAMAQNKVLAKKIALTIGLFCGGTKDMRYRNLLLELMHCPADELQNFAFRGQGWPGVIQASDISGQTYTVQTPHPRIGRIWSKALFTPLRCLLCDDPLAGQADVAVGDPWRLDYAAHSAGNSLAIVRTAKGHDAIGKAVATGDIVSIRIISEMDIITSQTGILWRRYYAWSRARLVSRINPAWKQTIGRVPNLSVADTVKAVRALGRSFWSWRSK